MLREEHPNPQFYRKNWENLNGEWEFEIDRGNSGVERKIFAKDTFERKITVPFCPESVLSGVCENDFLNSVWYKKNVFIPDTKDRIFLHIGACDYYTTVYVNGKKVGDHKGGYTPFAFDISSYVKTNQKNSIVIHAVDDYKNSMQARGKQSVLYYSHETSYSRTTGIWQTVWLEYVPQAYIKSVKYYPDAQNSKLIIRALVEGEGTFTAKAYYQGKEVGCDTAISNGENADLVIKLSEKHLWEVGNGRLYDLKLQFEDDIVDSYFGLRSTYVDGYRYMLNGKSVFQRTVLDQGYYKEGIYTAPSEEDMINDIKISQDMGFNGARLHQKVFEPRFLYHCDKMGYLVWGEYASWGVDHSDYKSLPVFLKEWEEVLERDFNHPAIIGWCPLNETWDIEGRKQRDEIIRSVYETTKMIDDTRPCIDTSGNFHVVTDVYDFHDYEQDVEKFKAIYEKFETEGILQDQTERNDCWKGKQRYNGEAVFASEYGGIALKTEGDESGWGYGDASKSQEEFVRRYEGLTNVLLDNSKIFGFCYTQLYDVEQEKNGLYTYERKAKINPEIIKNINSKKAKIED